MAIPALREYRKQNPNTKLGIATLKKIGYKQANEILGPHVDDVFPVLSEPWDWIEKYGGTLENGRRVVAEEASELALQENYATIKEITTSPELHVHKVRRVAMELGIYPLKDDRPRIQVPQEYIDFGKKFVEGMPRPIWFFHWKARNELKTLRWQTISELINTYKHNYKMLIECDSNLVKMSCYEPKSILETAGLLMNVDRVLAIDSVVSHIAYSIGVPLISIFTMTNPEQIFGPTPDFSSLTIVNISNR